MFTNLACFLYLYYLISIVNSCVYVFFFFQPGVCNATVLCIVPPEEVSDLPSARRDLRKAVLWLTSYPVCVYVCVVYFSSMSVSGLEPELQEKIRANHPGVERVYFNKGLWVQPEHCHDTGLALIYSASQLSSTSFNVPKLSLSPSFFNQLLSLWLFLLWLLEKIYSDWERWGGCPKAKWILLCVQYFLPVACWSCITPQKSDWFFKYLCSPFAKSLISASHSWWDYITMVNI